MPDRHVTGMRSRQVMQVSEECGLYGIAVGGWSHATASCVATAESVLECEALDTRDMMMRLLRMYRTGRGTCLPGRSGGLDAASEMAFNMVERSTKNTALLHGCSSPPAANSAALARVAPVVLFKWRTSASEAVSAAADTNARATHDLVATRDTARYMAAVVEAMLEASGSPLASKAQVLRRRNEAHKYASLCLTRPFERQVRDVADGSFLAGPHAPPHNRRDAAPDVLAQALWALHHGACFLDGLDRLLAIDASASVLWTYGCLGGCLFGYEGLPAEWLRVTTRLSKVDELALRLYSLSRPASPVAPDTVPRHHLAAVGMHGLQSAPGA